MSLPTELVNRALDAAGCDIPDGIGDIENGTRESNIALRHYIPVMRQLMRAAHWDCCRKQAPLTLLADATGQTQGVGTVVPQGWIYEYAYPTDCLKARYIPQSPYSAAGAPPAGNIAVPSVPATPVNNTLPPLVCPIIPTRFLVTTDFNYPGVNPAQAGIGAWWDIPGISPTNRTVILSNVKNAYLVYTCLQVYPNLWDALFDQAYVSALASEYALPLSKDKKFGLTMRAQNIAIAKEKIMQARITDGNEGVTSVDHVPDFIRIRNAGGWRGPAWYGASGIGGGGGVYGYGWDSYGFSDGSAY